MDDMESKMNAILSDPDMMQKIMSMAQSLGQSSPAPDHQESTPTIAKEPQMQLPASFPDIDISMIQRLSGFAKQTGVDKNQQTLLRALGPYLSHERVNKLEKAMRAAKMANLASTFLNSQMFQSFLGR